MIGINASAVKGEKGTGFEKRGTKGDFECGNCEYFKTKDRQRGCYQEDMMKKSKEPRNPNGSVKVDPPDCCEYIDRLGTIRKGMRKE
jgi:hypothetical protein